MRIWMLLLALFCSHSISFGQIIPPPTIHEEDVIYTCTGVLDVINECINVNEWLINNNRSIKDGIANWKAALATQVVLQIMYINSGEPTPKHIIDNINIIRQRIKDMEDQIVANNQAIQNNYQLRVKLSKWYDEHCVGKSKPMPLSDPNFP